MQHVCVSLTFIQILVLNIQIISEKIKCNQTTIKPDYNGMIVLSLAREIHIIFI